MNSRSTWVWLFLAIALLGAIVALKRYAPKTILGPERVLPGFQAKAVNLIQIRPAGRQLEIRVELTNHTWQLTAPFPFRSPAHAGKVQSLLTFLEQVTPATIIPEKELKNRYNADEEYGFANPQATITLNQRETLRVGCKTVPGDQVFLQVVGRDVIYVVDAELLKFLPHAPNDWRDTAMASLQGLSFNRVLVTNKAGHFALQREAAAGPWRLVDPYSARADNALIVESLQRLQQLQIQQFVNDETNVDWEPFGLQPAEMDVVVADGTNTLLQLQFGQSPTNDARQVYARRSGQYGVVAVAREPLLPWSAGFNSFRDPHLVALPSPPDRIEVVAEDTFQVQRQAGKSWFVTPQNFAADAALVETMVTNLATMQITHFVNDVVTPPDLPGYGLAPPARQYTLKATTNAAGVGTNLVLATLQFGTNTGDKVFARRTDETSVYGVRPASIQNLPQASWQLRSRRLWDFEESDIAQVTIQQHGRQRQIVRKDTYSWSLAPGSNGIIDDLALGTTVRGLVSASAVFWTARGEQNRARYGFADPVYRITFELKSGAKHSIEFGGEAPSTFTYAAVKLDGQLWIGEFPPDLYSHVLNYLSVPAS